LRRGAPPRVLFFGRWDLVVESQPTISIIDDDPDYLESLSLLVRSMGFSTKSYARGGDFLASDDSLAAGCVILDLKLPDLQGIAVLEALGSRPLAPPVIVMTAHAEVTIAVRALRSSVVASFQKHAVSETSLREAIHRAFARDADLRAAHARREEVQSLLALLSAPERQVLELLVQGFDHTRIAEALGISRRTVENRRAKLMKKLRVAHFPQLVRLAMEAELFRDA
jgi:two-component system response regulator FixJ